MAVSDNLSQLGSEGRWLSQFQGRGPGSNPGTHIWHSLAERLSGDTPGVEIGEDQIRFLSEQGPSSKGGIGHGSLQGLEVSMPECPDGITVSTPVKVPIDN